MKHRVLLVGAGLLSINASGAYAQTKEQLKSEGNFVRTLIKARDAKDCKLTLRLIDQRQTELRSQAQKLRQSGATRDAIKSDESASYLATQMQGLSNRRAIVARECR